MKYLFSFNEKYGYKEEKLGYENNPHCINYYFTNKDGINFKVSFNRTMNGHFEREYFTTNQKEKYGDLNTNDIYSIMSSVTQITIDFIKKYSPKLIIIYHIPSKKEREDRKLNPATLETPTKRALLNKRFLENKMPDGYKYELRGPTSYIKKID